MKKNHKNNNGFDDHKDEHDAEILKAVAQAWHGHSTSTKATTTVSESDASRRFFKGKPTRFKVERAKSSYQRDSCGSWDFRESLWDSYEIVAVSKKLERSLVMGDDEVVGGRRRRRRRRESSNSLRSLFNRVSSRRFTEDDDLPPVGGDDHEYGQD